MLTIKPKMCSAIVHVHDTQTFYTLILNRLTENKCCCCCPFPYCCCCCCCFAVVQSCWCCQCCHCCFFPELMFYHAVNVTGSSLLTWIFARRFAFSIFQLPIMHFVCPKILHKLLFSNSLGRTAYFQNNSLCKIWGANKVHYGQLENREWLILNHIAKEFCRVHFTSY